MSEMCGKLHELFRPLPVHEVPYDEQTIPLNGIYIVFERGQKGHSKGRIVRVGTHKKKDGLRERLRKHFIKENKDQSIFRKNIGRALLAKAKDPFLEQWELKPTPDKARRLEVERQVTERIQKSFCFVVFEVNGRKERLDLESKIISTVSWCEECGPSQAWFGRYSPKEKIRNSGLWLIQHLYRTPLSEKDFDRLQTLVSKTRSG